jgi:hypothetical protein
MVPTRVLIPVLAALALAGCSSEDPRLPQRIYDEAILLNQQGHNLEAQRLMKRLSTQYPESQAGQQATKDLLTLDALLRQDLREREKLLRTSMKRVADALTRYKGKTGEYPRFLSMLVPDYLDQPPETPWKDPYYYSPYVTSPIVDTHDRRGRAAQIFSTKLDGYILATLGEDQSVGGEDLASDTFIVNGEWYKGTEPPPIPQPQPLR